MLFTTTRSFARGASRFFATSASSSEMTQVLRDRITGYVNADKVVVFMKGTQQQPMCGFSNNVKKVLDFHDVKFHDYNVLEDQELREGIKVFSEWPTIPQIYVNGKFIGGCDILVDMHKDGEITEFFDENEIPNKFSEKK